MSREISTIDEGFFSASLQSLFSSSDFIEHDVPSRAPQNPLTRVGIVGGGLAGLLTALALSRQPHSARQVVLFESSASLGGRHFSPASASLTGMNAFERFSFLCKDVFENRAYGMGWEALSEPAWDVLRRLWEGFLSEPEIALVESFCDLLSGEKKDQVSCQPAAHADAWVIKKEKTAWAHVIAGSPSEFLSKRDSLALAGFLTSMGQLYASSESGVDGGIPLLQTDLWNALTPAHQQAIQPFIETLCQVPLASLSRGGAAHLLNEALGAFGWPPSPDRDAPHASGVRSGPGSWPNLRRFDSLAPMRNAGLELALELVLRKRGVQVRTSCRVLKCTRSGVGFELRVSDDVSPQQREWGLGQVIWALPVIQLLALVNRDDLTPSQSKAASRCRPRSLLFLEKPLHSLLPQTNGLLQGVQPCAQLLFPQERVRGYIPWGRVPNKICLWASLDYESSLSAPAVKEVLQRLRKAIHRLVGDAHHKNDEFERIALLPVGFWGEQPVPLRPGQDTCLAKPGLYLVGEMMSGRWEHAPVSAIAESVRACVAKVESYEVNS